MLADHLGLEFGGKECLHFFETFSDKNSPRQGASEVELRELARKCLLQETQSYAPATQVVPPSFVTAAFKYTAIMLSQFPIERCVDFLAFQADAAVTSIGAGGDGAKRRVEYGRKQTDCMEARTKLPAPLHTQAQGYIVQRVSPGLVVWELYLSFSAATQIEGQFWFRHNGHAPKPGPCLHVVVANKDLRIAVAGALASAPPYDKTPKIRPDWALQLNRGLWTDLLKLSTLRSHCSVGITLPDRPLRRSRPDTQNLTRRWAGFIAASHILAEVCRPEALQFLPCKLIHQL